MSEIKKIQFHNPPTPQHEAVLEEKKVKEELELKEKERAEKEAEIQPVIKEQFEEVIAPPKPMEWWVKRILFWGMFSYIVIISIIPVFRAIKYSMGNSANIQFSKEKPELITAMREYREARIKEVDTKIISAFSE